MIARLISTSLSARFTSNGTSDLKLSLMIVDSGDVVIVIVIVVVADRTSD